MEQDKIPGDIWDYFEKLVGQVLRRYGDIDKAREAVVDVYQKIQDGKIDLNKAKHPYTYLVRCVQRQFIDNFRKLQAQKRKFSIANMVVVDDKKLEGLAAPKTSCTTIRVPKGDYQGGDIDFGWHVRNVNTGKKESNK